MTTKTTKTREKKNHQQPTSCPAHHKAKLSGVSNHHIIDSKAKPPYKVLLPPAQVPSPKHRKQQPPQVPNPRTPKNNPPPPKAGTITTTAQTIC